MKWSKYLFGLFIFYALAEILTQVMGGDSRIHWVAKSLILPSLTGYYLTTTTHRSTLFIMALTFCWIGDVLLLEQGELFFMGGLGAFLTGHIFYIVSYRKHQNQDRTKELMSTQKLRYSFPVILAGTGLLVILFPKLGGLKIPVSIYAVVLMIMVMTALFRFGRTSAKSFWMVLAGASLFMISDSLLAINKFYAPFPVAGTAVMITYISAQYLIVEGILKHND